MRAYRPARRFRPFACAIVAGCWGLISLHGAAAAPPQGAAVVAVCSAQTRMILAETEVKDGLLQVRATCADDRRGKTSESLAQTRLPFAVAKATPLSIGEPGIDAAFEVTKTLGARRQGLTIARRGGGGCAHVIATTARPDPALKRFISSNGDWGSSVGYAIDESCGVLIVTLGDRVAAVNPAAAASFDLYGIHFTAGP